jgi:peroxiredoxin
MKTLFAFALILGISLMPLSASSQSKLKMAPQKAPNFSLKTANGKTIELSKLKGKVVVVNFWATWCPPCRAEIPGFVDLYKKYKSKGVEIVGISLDQEGWDAVNPFLQKNNINYPIVVGNEELSNSYGSIEAIPTTFIIDKKGYIAEHHVGYFEKEKLEKALKSLL